VDQEAIFTADPSHYLPGNVHFGSRIVFDGKGHLFLSIGERGQGEDAQKLDRPNGKIHRLALDGSIPKDNPFVGKAGALPSIFTFGNRNPQGLAWRLPQGELWETEHGPRGGDELNLIQAASNYGWPRVTYGMNYNGTPMTALTAMDGMVSPILHWTPSIAVCAMAFYHGAAFPAWKGHLFVTALGQQEFRRLVIEGRGVVDQEILWKGRGRVREVVEGPDGFLYLALNKPDLVIRLVPAQ
jgi:glucose/arabinose dehydrogenase